MAVKNDDLSVPLLADVDVVPAVGDIFGKSTNSVNIQAIGHLENESRDIEYFEFNFRGRGAFRVRLSVLNIFLTIMSIISTLMVVITLPLFSQSMDHPDHKTDEFPVLLFSATWFPLFFFSLMAVNKWLEPDMVLKSTVSHRVMFITGLLNTLNGLLVVYASDPSRTSPQLQAILGTSLIPFTVICRCILLRKGVSFSRLVCTGIILIGLFISLEPVVFNINQQGGGGSGYDGTVTGFARIIWPSIFTLGFLPVGFINAILERELKKDETESLVFQAWFQFYSMITIVLLFWTDFIPGFGAASNPTAFWANLKYGAGCMYGKDPSCYSAVVHSVVYIFSSCLANHFNLLLVRFAESSVYLVIVQALVTPLGALFWTIFQPSPVFHWGPTFDLATAFVLGGLVIMVPAVVMYNYFAAQEAKLENAKQKMIAVADSETE